MNLGDLLARWMAELGGGSIDLFTARCQWLIGTESTDAPGKEPRRWLRDAAALGHIEVHWETGKWRAAPLVLTRIPASDGLALVCGPRTTLAEALLEQSAPEVHRVEQLADDFRLPRPSAVYIQYEPGTDLRALAKMVRAIYVPCAAEQLADLLPRSTLGPPAAPPARDNQTLERFNAHKVQWQLAAGERPVNGAYRYTMLGRTEARWHENGAWYRMELSTGIYRALAGAGTSVMRYRPDGPAARTGQLFVDWGAPLPPLHGRAAVLCSGLMPRFPASAQNVMYENVPRPVAERIAASLNQRLEAV